MGFKMDRKKARFFRSYVKFILGLIGVVHGVITVLCIKFIFSESSSVNFFLGIMLLINTLMMLRTARIMNEVCKLSDSDLQNRYLKFK